MYIDFRVHIDAPHWMMWTAQNAITEKNNKDDDDDDNDVQNDDNIADKELRKCIT